MKIRFIGLVLAALAVAGCSLSTGTDDLVLEKECGTFAVREGAPLFFEIEGAAAFSEQDVVVTGMTRSGEPALLFEAHSIGVDGLSPESIEFFIPNAFDGASRAQLYVYFDTDGDREWTDGTDPSWSVPVCADGYANLDVSLEAGEGGVIVGQDLTDPAPARNDADYKYQLRNFDAHDQKLFELRMFDLTTGRTVAYVRNPSIQMPDFGGRMEDLVVDGRSYRIDFYADNDGSGGFSGLPDDHVWRSEGTATGGGLDFEYVHDTDFTEIEWEEP